MQVLTPDSPRYVVEKTRNLAEFLVYGQKYDESTYFEEFIEEDVLKGHLSRFLAFKNRLISIQVIQTVSILVQNIEDKAHLFYLLGNPFLSQLISFDFAFAQDDELTDYFVNFLKALVLRLDNTTINFFFDNRLKTFPLFETALTLYNSKE